MYAQQIKVFLKDAATAEDNGNPLKGLDYKANSPLLVRLLEAFNTIQIEEIEDTISVTAAGRAFAGLLPQDVPDLGQARIAELKGDVIESELAARYIEGKVEGCQRCAINQPDRKGDFFWLARVLGEIASEFRQGMHLPETVIEGRVIPYNESNDTGIKHEANLTQFFADVHERNCRAGWWTELETGQPLKRSPGEMMMLIVTELNEAYDSWLRDSPDDKLPEYPGLGVEMADALIRLADFCGAAMAGKIIQGKPARNPGDRAFRQVRRIANDYEIIRRTSRATGQPELADFLPPIDIAAMVDSKLAYNANREDHRIENRVKPDGKKT